MSLVKVPFSLTVIELMEAYLSSSDLTNIYLD